MNTHIKYTALILFFYFTTVQAHAQGCSDAGFCTINSVKPSTTDSNAQYKNDIKIAGFIGGADHSIGVRGAYLDYSRRLNNKFGFDLRVTTLGQSGNGITTFGFSDVFVNGNYRIRNNIKLNIGAK
ncbi:MAG: hypothetical protein IT244_07295, partial [Bacteroidia bacterium]|nr:hypothetical protein [Bacteroidia bacterium]